VPLSCNSDGGRFHLLTKGCRRDGAESLAGSAAGYVLPRHSGTPTPRWLGSAVLGIGLASLFSEVAHEMASTAMPAFPGSLGMGSAALGLIEGLADGTSSVAKLPASPAHWLWLGT
jgi:hypothetical protein